MLCELNQTNIQTKQFRTLASPLLLINKGVFWKRPLKTALLNVYFNALVFSNYTLTYLIKYT